MAERTPADEIRQAAAALRDGSNSIDVLLRARKPVAAWLESWDGFDIPESAPHSDDWEHALGIARAINGSDRD